MALLLWLRSKSTGDPWLTDGSYFDGTGYAEIKFESQFGTTKRFEQEIRLVSYNGIIFFLENEAGACSPGEPSRLSQFAGQSQPHIPSSWPWKGLWRWQCYSQQCFCTVVKSHKRAGLRPHSTGNGLSGTGGSPLGSKSTHTHPLSQARVCRGKQEHFQPVVPPFCPSTGLPFPDKSPIIVAVTCQGTGSRTCSHRC